MRNINNILKLANFYSYAVSQVLNLSDTRRDITTIYEKINNFYFGSDLTQEQQKQLAYKIVKMAQDKFNKLVVPYLDMEPVYIAQKILNPSSTISNYLEIISFYLHDFIHEASLPGSLKKFEEKDKEDSPYSLEEIIEEQSVGTASYGSQPQLNEAVYNIINPIIENLRYEFHSDQIISQYDKLTKELLSLQENNFNDPSFLNETKEVSDRKSEIKSKIELLKPKRTRIIILFLERVLADFFRKFDEDIENINNNKYKSVANNFFKYLKNYAKSIDLATIAHDNSLYPKSFDDIMNSLVQKLISNKYFYQFSLRQVVDRDMAEAIRLRNIENVKKEFSKKNPNEEMLNIVDLRTVEDLKKRFRDLEKPVMNLWDERKASLLRRWLLAVDQGVDNILKQNS